MHPAARIILPHHKNGARAHAVSTSALSAYAVFILVGALTLQILLKGSGLVLGYANDIHTDEIVSLTNLEREKAGLGEVELSEQLSLAARAKAEDMFADDYWAHIARDGTTPWIFIEKSGYEFYAAGENLARDFNDSESVVRAWMNSPSHKDNLLGANYRDIGVAVVNGELAGTDTTLVVQMFGITRQDQLALAQKPAEESKVEISPAALAIETPVPPQPEVPVAQTEEVLPQESPVLASTPESAPVGGIMKFASIAFIGFLLMVFMLDLIYVYRKGIVRVSGNTIAHVSMLTFLIIVVWWAKGGLVL